MKEKKQVPKLAYSIAELAEATSFSKVYIRNEIREGKIKAKKKGRRILILKDDALEYLNNFENYKYGDKEK